jgi:hypothetical protein
MQGGVPEFDHLLSLIDCDDRGLRHARTRWKIPISKSRLMSEWRLGPRLHPSQSITFSQGMYPTNTRYAMDGNNEAQREDLELSSASQMSRGNYATLCGPVQGVRAA